MFQPHSLPPPSEAYSPASATSPSPLLKGAERPTVLAPAMASVAPSAVHTPTGHGSSPQYGIRSTGDDAQREGGREAGGEERVMVLPWSLGERVFALLGGRHGEGSRNGGSAVGTEALPPYEERDERM
ncbi:hypothetical protein TRAPUB_8947 [Trametes pubescens]|uniref:Uncharacterized protein n=1 Tax=Trametes pubescens TaxID=154538 RepID=A0A1M2W3S5_TRAPU|nr:hypothetical protein TRAPUB_8947 [Trametes pubescens]